MALAEAARWMRGKSVKKSFLGYYGGECEIRDNGYNIILEFVPVKFKPDSKDSIRQMEQRYGWEEGEVITAKYIKEEWRRTPGQRTAFVSMTLRSAKVANKILREGMVINGKYI
jgi:hypothetical protein